MTRPAPLGRLGIITFLLLGVLTLLTPLPSAHAARSNPRSIVHRDGTIAAIHKYSGFISPPKAPKPNGKPTETHVDTIPLPPPANAPESVIGKDGRVQVKHTDQYPFAAITQLEVYFPKSAVTCTGWMIGPHTVATAAHCIYEKGYGGYASSIMVFPGRNGTAVPFGKFDAADWYTNLGWVNTEAPKYDYAVIQLGSDIDSLVGYFGYGYRPNRTFLTNHTMQLTGYPGDKAYGTLWKMGGNISKVNKTRLFYDVDTYGGESGAPVYGKWGTCEPCSFGIHTYGVLFGTKWTENSATRISKPVYNMLCTARGGC